MRNTITPPSLSAEGPILIKDKSTIRGTSLLGKTHAAIVYARNHADDYHALFFVFAATRDDLHCKLAAPFLCDPTLAGSSASFA